MKKKLFLKRRKWFTDRIGNRVFRNKITCKCKIYQSVYENGLIVMSEMHADYLHSCESDFTTDGDKLKYFDTKKEAENFENK